MQRALSPLLGKVASRSEMWFPLLAGQKCGFHTACPPPTLHFVRNRLALSWAVFLW